MIVLQSDDDAITLKDIEFPDEARLYGTIPKRDMNGLLRTTKKTPCQTRFRIRAIALGLEKYEEIIAFFKNTKGKLLIYTDWKENQYTVRLTNKIVIETNKNYRSLTVELETV